MILPLYKSFVSSHLDYAVEFWFPHLRRDIDKIEKLREEQQRWYKLETAVTASD